MNDDIQCQISCPSYNGVHGDHIILYANIIILWRGRPPKYEKSNVRLLIGSKHVTRIYFTQSLDKWKLCWTYMDDVDFLIGRRWKLLEYGHGIVKVVLNIYGRRRLFDWSQMKITGIWTRNTTFIWTKIGEVECVFE